MSYSIVTGKLSRIMVVDCDSEDSYQRIQEHLPESLETPVAKSPHGYHIYFQYREGLSSRRYMPEFMSEARIKLIILFFVLSTIFSCVPSLVYSPSINLPPKPLEKDETQILGGVGYFPETRADRVSSKMVFGGEATIRHAFANSFSLQLEGWYDFSNNVEDGRWGLSLASIIVFNDSSNYRFGLMPIFAAAFANNSIEGGGCYIPVTFWFNHLDPLNFYAAIGPVVGIRDITDDNNQ